MKKNGFTLAEVLITLGIIGVVASITIPTLMNNIQDQQFKSSYKKVYSMINEATLEIAADNGGTIKGLFTDTNTMIDYYASKMKTLKACHLNDASPGCFSTVDASIILVDGSVLWNNVNSVDTNCNNDAWGKANFGQNVCSEFYIDVNGNNKPNKEGKDRFWVGIGENKVIPAGIDGMVNSNYKCPNGLFCNSYLYLVQ